MSNKQTVYLSDIHFKKGTSIDYYIPIGLSKDTVLEINFHSRLNSFCLSGDITYIDINNNFLNFINEQDVQCEVTIYKCPVNDSNDVGEGKKFLQYLFFVSKIDVLSFSADSSTIKVYLEDKISRIASSKQIHYSNYDYSYDDADIERDIREIMTPLKSAIGTDIVIPEKVFGENISNYKCRFVSSFDETVEEALVHYLENLYENNYDESLLTPGFNEKRKIPDRLVAYAPSFEIDKEGGIIKVVPRLTSAIEIVDEKEVDVPESSFKYAKKKIDGLVEGLTNQMNVQVAFSKIVTSKNIKDLIPIAYSTNWLDKTTGNHDKDYLFPDESPIFINNYDKIKSDFDNPFPGYGKDPDFKINKIFQNKDTVEKYSSTAERRYYGDNSERTLYQDMASVMLCPYVYVTCPGSAMHSPGQVIDLRYIRVHPKLVNKELNLSFNKLFSGKWKIMNSTTKFSSTNIKTSLGLEFQEVLGLNRLGYFFFDDNKSPDTEESDDNITTVIKKNSNLIAIR